MDRYMYSEIKCEYFFPHMQVATNSDLPTQSDPSDTPNGIPTPIQESEHVEQVI
jgi:hypothetical protein